MRRTILMMTFAAALSVPAASAYADYKIGAGDTLKIQVHGQDELSGDIEVNVAGKIELELLGEVKAAGLTPAELDHKLTTSLTKYLRQPSVSVGVSEYASQKVYVLGGVVRPGRYVLKGERNVLDILLEAGGPSDGSQRWVHLLRASQADVQSHPIDLKALLVAGDFTNNMTVQAGDVIYVPPVGESTAGVPAEGTRVYVVGEVHKPGLFKLEPGATAMAAVLAAGGLTKYASGSRAKVVRNEGEDRHVMKVNLADIMKNGRKDKDIALRPGDMVIVPGRLF